MKIPFLSFFGLVPLGFNISPIEETIICFPWQFFRMFMSQHVQLKWPPERKINPSKIKSNHPVKKMKTHPYG